jgi:hypothetical protein
MGMHLHVCPHEPGMSRKEFCEHSEPFSIALDGYVKGGPWFDKKGPRANFNHHEDVDRMATRSTCGQVYLAIWSGLFLQFHNKRGHHAHVYVNDCDEDVCMAWFLLLHGDLAEQKKKNKDKIDPEVYRRLYRLVTMEDNLDTTSGAYCLPTDYPVLREVNWVFDPYQQFRLSGGLRDRDAQQFREIIDIICGRAMQYIKGHGEIVELDMRFEVVGGGPNWSMVKKIGAQARTGMFEQGIHAYITVAQRGEERCWDYSLGRTSVFVDFDLLHAYRRLNKAEDLLGNPDYWGGGNTTGGSPRVSGSKLSPAQVEEIINSECTCNGTGNGNAT